MVKIYLKVQFKEVFEDKGHPVSVSRPTLECYWKNYLINEALVKYEVSAIKHRNGQH